jgi:hypothetical protein
MFLASLFPLIVDAQNLGKQRQNKADHNQEPNPNFTQAITPTSPSFDE